MIQRYFIQYRNKAINPLSGFIARAEQFMDQQQNVMKEVEILGKDAYHSKIFNGSFANLNVNHLHLFSSNDVERISTIPNVQNVFPVEIGRVTASIHEVPWSRDALNIKALHDEGLRGQGLSIGVIDTGIDIDHPEFDFQKNNLSWFDPVESNGQVTDIIGHGTHVAGIMCGKNVGVAPESNLFATRTIDNTRPVTFEHVVRSFDFMFKDDKNYPCVVNNSWGFPYVPNDEGVILPFRNAIDYLKSQGIANIFAIGNDGPMNNSISSIGGNDFAFSVGATDKSTQIADFSSRGPGGNLIKPELSAPGKNILSATLDNQYVEMSGTSMATPHISGLYALVNQFAKQRGFGWTVDQKFKFLQNSTIDLGEKGMDNTFGMGLIDGNKLLSNMKNT